MNEYLKIKRDKTEKIMLEWQIQKPEGGGADEKHFYSYDKPLPSFNAALDNLKEHVLKICEYPVDDDHLKRLTVTGVSFSYGGKTNVMGATIIAQFQLKDSLSPLNINTPHKIEEFYSESGGDDRSLMTSKMADDLYMLEAEAERYLFGEREKQEELFDKKEPAMNISKHVIEKVAENLQKIANEHGATISAAIN